MSAQKLRRKSSPASIAGTSPSAVTMREVARGAGVSVATVSRALRGGPEVPKKMRDRVRAIAREMGYQLHPFVSALMHSRRVRSALSHPPPLAFVTAFPTATGWQKQPTPLFPLMFSGACERAAHRGYPLTHYWLHQEGMSQPRFSEMLRARGVRGILLPPPPQYNFPIELTWQHFSTVILGVTPLAKQFHCAANDHYQSMQTAMEMCWQKGYRRPGLAIDARANQRLERRWEAAFRTAPDVRPFAAAIPPLFFSQWNAATIKRWIDREKPDVVVSVFTESHLRELRSEGLRIPGDVGLLSLSLHDVASPLAGIRQHAALVGAVAVDQLIANIERNEHGLPQHPITLSIRGSWSDGATLPPR